MNDTVIKAENIGKIYAIGQQAETRCYVALRDVLMQNTCELGKPSCCYDPTGLVQKDDQAAHGIEIIRGPEELKKWVKAI